MALTFPADARPISSAPARAARFNPVPVLRTVGFAVASLALVTGLWLAPLLALGAAGTVDPARSAMSCGDGWVMRFEHDVPLAEEAPLACFPAPPAP